MISSSLNTNIILILIIPITNILTLIILTTIITLILILIILIMTIFMMVGSVTSGNKGTMQDFSSLLLLFPCQPRVGELNDDDDHDETLWEAPICYSQFQVMWSCEVDDDDDANIWW